MNLFKAFLFILVCIFFQLQAGTVRIFNDSPYKLRAVVRGADGSYLGELVMLPQHYAQWTDNATQFGVFGPGNPYSQGPPMPQNPYTVMFYCMDGSDFSVCTNVNTGATITALTCDGTRICKPAPKKKNPNPNAGTGEELNTPLPEETP